jgi:predicted AAA+ superfamily ATPase
MAQSNRERLTRAFDLLAEGLGPFVDDVMTEQVGPDWNIRVAEWGNSRSSQTLEKTDVQVMLRMITENGRLFKDELSRAQQAFGSELREVRNRWAHTGTFSSADTSRALDTMARLLEAIDAKDSAADVAKLRDDVQRSAYEEQTRQKTRRVTPIADTNSGLPAWRDVLQPHEDVARGDFSSSEFAADLHVVSHHEATSPEYADPIEFFDRTYLTVGLTDLLTRGLRRMSEDTNASPVVNLQTNFGGGKTHSMLALWHLFSGTKAEAFPQHVQDLIHDAGDVPVGDLGVRRVALVGNKLQPGRADVKADGTMVNTLWGELAWQLGGREAFEYVAEADRLRVNPGDALREMLKAYSPALILIDEWVAYARELVGKDDLPAGAFDSQFSFAQTLTESVSAVPGCMLVVSIPASDAGAGNDLEIGGENGRKALDRLQNVVRRVADQWRPSTKDESFEIVRRRLFREPDAAASAQIAAVARSFSQMYQKDNTVYPREVTTGEYEDRIRASYPLHPELLDQLYEGWSALPRFQRTRGVLTLVSSIVSELWKTNDQSPLIMPGSVPLSADAVNTNLTQYLEDRWKAIIDADIDGYDATSSKIDQDKTVLGQRGVTRRIARTIFMGSAPNVGSETTRGLDKQRVWLGTAVPRDVVGNFGMALEQMSLRSMYFYEEQGRYWFDTTASAQKTASDFAERLREDPETVWNEIVSRLRSEERSRGVFSRVHVAPASSADIPDLEDVRLVIMHPKDTIAANDTEESSSSMTWVRHAVENRGAAQRVHRNTVVFLAADRQEEESLEGAVRSYLGWKHVLDGASGMDLKPSQRENADKRTRQDSATVDARLSAAYTWVVYPDAFDPTEPFTIEKERASESAGSLVERAAKKLQQGDRLSSGLGPDAVGLALHDQAQLGSLWARDGQVAFGDLWSYFTRYVYMPRVTSRAVLEKAVSDATSSVLARPEEQFALASGVDEATGEWRGLIVPPVGGLMLSVTDSTLLVDYGKAVDQRARELARAEEERKQREAADVDGEGSGSEPGPGPSPWPPVPGGSGETGGGTGLGPIDPGPGPQPPVPPVEQPKTSFFGTVTLGRDDYSKRLRFIATELISLLEDADDLEVTVDIRATKADGFTEAEQRTVSENAHTLKFGNCEFCG